MTRYIPPLYWHRTCEFSGIRLAVVGRDINAFSRAPTADSCHAKGEEMETKTTQLPGIVETPNTALLPDIPQAEATEPIEVIQLLSAAVQQGADVDVLAKLVDLQERISDRQSISDYAAAVAEFQDDLPVIEKTTTATITPNSGARYSYNYATLDHICNMIRPIMRQHGLMVSWDSSTEGDRLKCICKVTHVGGHSETATFECSTDSHGSMSKQQKAGGALTFAKRHSLIQALGITTSEPDLDGASGEAISDVQLVDLCALIQDVGADEKRFRKWAGVENLKDMQADRLAVAVTMLEAKRKGGKK